MGQRPRCFKPDTIYEQTQRTVDRQFLLAPVPGVKNAVGAAAGRAQQRHPVKIYWLEVNSNHEHMGIGAISNSREHIDNLVKFKQTYHRILAEEINRLHNRSGALFSTPARTTECLDNESAESQMFYAITNPVKDNLVERVAHWEGFSSYAQMVQGKDETYTYYDRTAYTRQKCKPNARPLSAFIKTVRVEFSRLPHLTRLKFGAYESYLRREVRRREQEFSIERENSGQTVIGKSKLTKTNPRSRPINPKQSGQKPVCHCQCNVKRSQYKEEMRAFYRHYIVASATYRAGAYDTEFPYGSIRPPLHDVSV